MSGKIPFSKQFPALWSIIDPVSTDYPWTRKAEELEEVFGHNGGQTFRDFWRGKTEIERAEFTIFVVHYGGLSKVAEFMMTLADMSRADYRNYEKRVEEQAGQAERDLAAATIKNEACFKFMMDELQEARVKIFDLEDRLKAHGEISDKLTDDEAELISARARIENLEDVNERLTRERDEAREDSDHRAKVSVTALDLLARWVQDQDVGDVKDLVSAVDRLKTFATMDGRFLCYVTDHRGSGTGDFYMVRLTGVGGDVVYRKKVALDAAKDRFEQDHGAVPSQSFSYVVTIKDHIVMDVPIDEIPF